MRRCRRVRGRRLLDRLDGLKNPRVVRHTSGRWVAPRMWALLPAERKRLGDAAGWGKAMTTRNRGSANGRAILSEAEVLAIHQMARRYSQGEIAEMFGLSRECVSIIQREVRWEHLFEVEKVKE
jgi:hypothetical protein